MFKKKFFYFAIFLIILSFSGCNKSSNQLELQNLHSQDTSSANYEPDEFDKIVYITPTGKRFHLKSTCAGKNAIKTFLSEIKSDYTPCKKCAR